MPSIFSVKPGTGGYSALKSDVSLPSQGGGSTGSSRFGAAPGRASVNITKPDTFGQSLDGLGQGFLGLIGSVPGVGGLLKGAVETVGGAAINAGNFVGSIRPFEAGPSVGDVVSGIPGAAMDVISAPSRFVQKDLIAKSAAEKLLQDKSGSNFQSVKDYYDIGSIRAMVDAGATADEIAQTIYSEGRTFGAKPDIIRDVALGLITDPLTYIPGGAIASGGARAGGLIKAVKTGVILAAKDSEFMRLWQPVGQVYNAISGTLSGTSKAFASAIAGRAHTILEMAYKPSNIKAAVAALAKVSPGEADSVIQTASELTSFTMGKAAKGGAAALIEDQAALAVQGSADDFVNSILETVRPFVEAKDAQGALAAVTPLLDAGMIPNNSRASLVNKVMSAVNAPEDIKAIKDSIQSKLQFRALAIDSAQSAEEALAIQGRLHGQSVVVAGAKLLISGKQELLALTTDVNAARAFVRNGLGYALGRSTVQADQFFDELILPAINAGKVSDALDYLEFVRAPAYGKLAQNIANVRQTMTGIGSRITLISQRTLSRARASQIADSLKGLGAQEAKAAIKQAVDQYDELYGRFGRIDLEALDEKQLQSLKDDMEKFLSDNSQTFAVDLQADELAQLSDTAKEYWAQAEKIGYRLGIAPEDGVIQKWSTLQDKYGRYYHAKSYSPYADLVDTAFTNPQNLGGDLLTYKRNPLQEMIRYGLSPRYGSLIQAKATNRFVAETTAVGLNQSESRAVWNVMNDLADQYKTLPRGLSYEAVMGPGNPLAKAINSALGKEALARIAVKAGVPVEEAWTQVFNGLMKAYAGHIDDIGIMPALTSWVKMKVPKVAIITDRFYPASRFGTLAPQFQYIQENIEPVFFRFTTGAGVREERIAGLVKNDIRTRAIMGEYAAVREVGDAQTVFMVAGHQTAQQMGAKAPTFWEAIGNFARGNAEFKDVRLSLKNGVLAVTDRKRRAMQAMISRGASLRANRVFAEHLPEELPNLQKFFGTSEPEDIMHTIGLDFIGRTDPVSAQKLMDAGVDVAMMREFTSRGVVATEVAINEKKFIDAGGEIISAADQSTIDDLQKFLSDYQEWQVMTPEELAAATKVRSQDPLKVLNDIEVSGNGSYSGQFRKSTFSGAKHIAIAKTMLEKNMTYVDALTEISRAESKLLKSMMDDALANISPNASMAKRASAENEVLDYFGHQLLRREPGVGWVYSSTPNDNAPYWKLLTGNYSLDEIVKKYASGGAPANFARFESVDKPAMGVLKDAFNRYYTWDPEVRKAAQWTIANGPDGEIAGFSLRVPEKLRAGITKKETLDNIAVTHLGAFQRGSGTGSALLADAHRAAKAEGIGMYVHDITARSKDFYKKLGFIEKNNPNDSFTNMMAPPDFMYKTVGKTDAEVQSYQNIVAGFRKAAADEGKRAQRAIYFDPNRPWIERSLNHPLLALYPLSYMVGKVIPEFTRLLVATPFAKALGGTRPFLGAEALRITAEATVAATQYDPNFRSWIEDNPESWILINWLLPYTPDNIGFGLSSTVRKLGVAKGMAGEGFDVGRFPQEGFNQVVSASLPGSWRIGFNAANQLLTQNPVADMAPDSLNITDILQGKN